MSSTASSVPLPSRSRKSGLQELGRIDSPVLGQRAEPRGRSVSNELEREQQYVGSLYGRLDELRNEAQSALEAVRRSNPGGTHQNRS